MIREKGRTLRLAAANPKLEFRKGGDMPKESLLLLKDMTGFAERARLTLDDLGQLHNKYGEFLGVVCSKCGGFKATGRQMHKMELWLKMHNPDCDEDCPVCICSK